MLVTRSCPTLCDPAVDCSPPDSSVRGILQARTLEWVVVPSSRGSSRPRDGSPVFCFAACSLLVSWFFVPGGASHGPLLPHPPSGSDLGAVFHLSVSGCMCVFLHAFVCVCVYTLLCASVDARVFLHVWNECTSVHELLWCSHAHVTA